MSKRPSSTYTFTSAAYWKPAQVPTAVALSLLAKVTEILHTLHTVYKQPNRRRTGTLAQR